MSSSLSSGLEFSCGFPSVPGSFEEMLLSFLPKQLRCQIGGTELWDGCYNYLENYEYYKKSVQTA